MQLAMHDANLPGIPHLLNHPHRFLSATIIIYRHAAVDISL